MRVVAIVQARLTSYRFPDIVIKKICGKPMIEFLLNRLARSKKVDKIVIAIPKNKKNHKLYNFLKSKKYNVFRGDEENVLKRYYYAAKFYKADVIIRLTADNPLVDPKLVDEAIIELIKNKKDYVSNSLPPTLPDGLDVEVLTFKTLKKCFEEAKSKFDIEHVTPFARTSGKFDTLYIQNEKNFSNERWTVDHKADFRVIKNVFEHFKPKIHFGWKEVLNLSKKKPSIFKFNNHLKREKVSFMSKGQKLWRKAKNIIPGGNMFLSKKPEIFLPDKWPTYFSKAKGCAIWDLDGKKLFDVGAMGIGTNILGYANKEVDKYVLSIIKKGNLSSLNCPEEVLLCEKLLKIHPWAEMVKLARTGGEANSIAVRIGRAASKKDKIAFCGYHGWHDWYLSSNISNKNNLNSHLLTGLKTSGVPKALKNTAFPFKYNDFKTLKKITEENEIGIIKMEVERDQKPRNNFLKKIRELANKKNIVLIFDECTSGFRENFGGLHKKYGVEPDIAIFGKALGNGYAITAIIGKRNVMDCAQDTFMSSTFWTERSGPAAGIKTLEVMEKIKSWELISKIGEKFSKNWLSLAKRNNLKINVSGLSSIKKFKILSDNWLKYKTYITQELLKKGFLASNSLYACIEHKDKIIDNYFNELDEIFKTISECKNEKGKHIDEKLESPVCYEKFHRLN